jgi:purine-binding chemotaxis protein CheW
MTQLQSAEAAKTRPAIHAATESFVTFYVQDQLFGIPVIQVQDILTPDVIAPVPLSPVEISGSINLRGRIVTVIDVRTRLAMPEQDAETRRRYMGVTVEKGGEFYTLLVDGVGDVVSLPAHQHEGNPATLDPLWREIAGGVYRMDGTLLVTLDVDRLIDIRAKS